MPILIQLVVTSPRVNYCYTWYTAYRRYEYKLCKRARFLHERTGLPTGKGMRPDAEKNYGRARL